VGVGGCPSTWEVMLRVVRMRSLARVRALVTLQTLFLLLNTMMRRSPAYSRKKC
jgi:hypothetical protein